MFAEMLRNLQSCTWSYHLSCQRTINWWCNYWLSYIWMLFQQRCLLHQLDG